MTKKNVLICSFVVMLLFLFGLVAPMLLMAGSEERYKGVERAVAKEALLDAKRILGGSPDTLIVTAMRIESVQVSETSARNVIINGTFDPNYPSIFGYVVVIKLYSFFGVPYGYVVVDDRRVSIERYWLK